MKAGSWWQLTSSIMNRKKFLAFALIFGIALNTVAAQQGGGGLRLTDAEMFAADYPLVGPDNLFVYRNARETAAILANGSGIVFMGFKECPWCQYYAVYLNEAAREMGIKRIFYCDIREDRQNNTAAYKRIVSILSNRLQYDDEGRERVFVPDVTILFNGRIIGRDYETSKETLGYKNPEEYWTRGRINSLKERLKKSIIGLIQSDDDCGC